jgi:hypothetical protein
MEFSQAMGVELAAEALGALGALRALGALGAMVYLEAARCGSAAHCNRERRHAHFQRSAALRHSECRSEADGAMPLQRQTHAGGQRG